MRRLRSSFLLAGGTLASVFVFAGPSFGDTVEIAAQSDNTLYESATGALSNGAGSFLFVGMTNEPLLRRAVISFDVAADVPAGTHILGVQLVLQMSMTLAGPTDIGLFRLSADWGEGTSNAAGSEGGGAASATGDATWIHTFFAGTTWTSPGGDFAGAASATLSVDDDGSYTWGSTAGMESDVQSWLDAPAGNFGWILIGDESTNPTAKRFNSRENSTASTRPKLLVTYGVTLFTDGFESSDTGNWSVVVP